MNIFVTDSCPIISAINLPDILVRKMIVETAQLLSGAYKAYLLAKFENWQTRTDKRRIVPTWTNRNKPDWVV